MNSLGGSTYVGTAGWTIPPQLREVFDSEGSHLERYSRSLNCVEINSSFYREHKPETYSKWASMVPSHFRFSTKLLRYFTQEKRLKETGSRLKEVLEGMSHLGEKWGALLVQLPPSLEFDRNDTVRFLNELRNLYSSPILWEPRHLSWCSDAALELLSAHGVSKVLADPEPCYLTSAKRRKVEKVLYYRLHGSPEIYKSRYSSEIIERLAKKIRSAQAGSKEAWCVFDNTTFGFATENALELTSALN
jgi:uncharacterized protein YecE (DUF72 family)